MTFYCIAFQLNDGALNILPAESGSEIRGCVLDRSRGAAFDNVQYIREPQNIISCGVHPFIAIINSWRDGDLENHDGLDCSCCG